MMPTLTSLTIEISKGRGLIGLFFFFFCGVEGAISAAYGGFQTRSQIRAVAAGLCHSRSNAGSQPCLQPGP